jgi:hypothetical protein
MTWKEAAVKFEVTFQQFRGGTEKNLKKHHIAPFCLLEDYRLIAERFARPNDPENYAGGKVSSW